MLKNITAFAVALLSEPLKILGILFCLHIKTHQQVQSMWKT